MLVRLQEQFSRAPIHYQSESNMAPYSINFDYRHQIIENCEFILPQHGRNLVTVVTSRNALGDFKAFAIRTNEDSREPLLSSEPCDTTTQAIESLYTKSCEATQNYITTNGFSFPPDLKKSKFDEDEDDDNKDEYENDDDDVASIVSGRSASSTVALSYWGSSDDEAAITPASSANPHAGRHHHEARGNKKGSISNKRRSKPSGTGKRASEQILRFADDDSDDDEHQPQQPPPRARLVSPIRSSSATNVSYRPPPPPPGWTGPPMPPPPIRGLPIPSPPSQPGPHYCQQPSPPGQPISVPIPPVVGAAPGLPPHIPTGPPAPPVRTNSIGNSSSSNTTPPSLHYKASAPNLGAGPPPPPSAPPRLYDVRLSIRWLGHGEQRILESSRASIRALQELAVAYVRNHAGAFDKGGSMGIMNAGSGWGLRACVRRAFFGPGEAYDMSAYRGDDLTKLFNVLSAGGIPRFEVEVDSVPPPPQQQQQH
ncbi:hypothetical protein F5Y04DRAFT_34753 [Hypomontagnella monticulosa]|nr:hypothetical protein F5Y04DRAFT_34753 [Hypomontagnella monticulosa]